MPLNPNIILQAGQGVTPINRRDPLREALGMQQIQNNQLQQNALRDKTAKDAIMRERIAKGESVSDVLQSMGDPRFMDAKIKENTFASSQRDEQARQLFQTVIESRDNPQAWESVRAKFQELKPGLNIPEYSPQNVELLINKLAESGITPDKYLSRQDTLAQREQAQRNADRNYNLQASKFDWQKNKPPSNGMSITGYDESGRPLIQMGGSAVPASGGVSKKEIEETVKANVKRLGDLNESRGMRQLAINKAKDFLSQFENGSVNSGAARQGLKMIPGAFTEQSKFDQKFDAFAEQAARAKLKALGEVRPTDADVKGMKESMFGISRDEDVNMALLRDFIAEQETADEEYRALLAAKKSGNLSGYSPSATSRMPGETDKPPQQPSNIEKNIGGVMYYQQDGKWYKK